MAWHSDRRRTSRSRRNRSATIRAEYLEERRVLAAAPVIAELMAVNESVLADEDGDFSDWLELANLGDQPIALGGWYLTDDPSNLTKWTVPELTLAPGESQLVFASGKDRAVGAPHWHTNFRLDADGEFLALVNSDGSTLAHAYQPSYAAQVSDVSYGLYGVTGEFGYFSLPTPGTTNSQPPSDVPPQAIVINEIMYHPASENDAEEYVELLNAGSADVDLTGWRIGGGIDVDLPALTLAPGEVAVVVADLNSFLAVYGVVSHLTGPWSGRLSNSSNTITLRDEQDRVVDRVRYADEGDWSERARGPIDNGTAGWVWSDSHDGGGRSLELVNPLLSNDVGQNWRASQADAGTPGRANSVAEADSPPLIIDLQQDPVIPRASDTVAIEARIVDESRSALTVQLHWRVDGAASFGSLTMRDDGQNGDRIAGDGVYHADIPAHRDGTVIEYYVSATDAAANTRTWPAETADSGQATNALFQVVDAFDPHATWQPGSPPVYYQIMTAVERETLTGINRNSDAQMNATFISVNGEGIEQRHGVGIRIRGSGSRNEPIPNNRINIPSDRPWQGATALNLNVVNVPDQIAGSVLMRLAGVSSAVATSVIMYSNGVNLLDDRPYAHLEPLNNDFADNHYPNDSGGNLYKGRRPDESPPGGQGAGLAYFGEDQAPYVSYTKLTNESQADWSDVVELTRVLNNEPDETYLQRLAEVVDIDQWLRFFAMNALVSNTEGGLVNGDRQGDDYAMYRGVNDSRFQMIPHDLDSILSQRTRQLITATNVPALNRFLLHPEIRPLYFQIMLDLVQDVFESPETEAVLRDTLGNLADPDYIENVMTFLRNRAEYVRGIMPNGMVQRTALPANDGRIVTTESGLGIWGVVDFRANSVLVNGQPARFTPDSSFFELGSSIATLFPWESSWQFLDDGSDQGTAWRETDFQVPATWKEGEAELGFGDGDEATIIGFGGDPDNRTVTTYFRHEFQIDDASRYTDLALELVRDDGAVAYLNGQEIARSNMPQGDIDYRTLANGNVNGGSERGVNGFGIDASLLVDGKNVLAIEVHQVSTTSNDLSMRARIRGRYSPPGAGVQLTPGLNSVVVQAMTGVDGTGDVVVSRTLEVWRQVDATVVQGVLPAGETRWRANEGPYQVRGQLEVPADGKLIIEPGTSVYFEADAELLVHGSLVADGTAHRRIRLTSVPGAPHVPDLAGLPDGPARWKGVHFVDTRSDDNSISFVDLEYAQDMQGSIGVVNSNLNVSHISVQGTHRRMIYGENASLTVRNSVFPDMFAENENPAELRLDNVSEHIKIVGRTPSGGQLIIQGNHFGTNKGHNDVIDADSNRVADGPILQVLDNVFTGAGDELLDLGGDVYVAGNLFRGVSKDDSTSDRGYANAISTGDAGANTTIVVARNVFYDVDHAINLKNQVATIFENNTVLQIHPDFEDRFGNPNVGAAITLYVDEPGATAGAGAYAAQNIFWDAPRVFGSADLPDGQVSALQLYDNLLSAELASSTIGQRPGTTLDLGTGNVVGDPRLADPAALDFSLHHGSPAWAPSSPTAWGADVADAAWVSGVPISPTPLRNVHLTVGGPGMFAMRYRVNGGVWSDQLPIGAGWNPSGTVRTAQISLQNLADGQYTVEVQGKDFAGNWQSHPTVAESFTVAGDAPAIVISELLANNQTVFNNAGTRPDLIELQNVSNQDVNLRGMRLSDDLARPDRFIFQQDLVVPAGGYVTLIADNRQSEGLHVGFALSQEGEAVYLFDPAGQLVDSIEFGPQVPDLSIGRAGPRGDWQLNEPTFGSPNFAAVTGDASLVSLNEWLAGGTGGGDFVELFNADSRPVDVSGFWLSDAGDATPDRHQVALLSFVPANGFLVFQADGDDQDGPDHLNFRLSMNQETLRLSDTELNPLSIVPIDRQAAGVSQGRMPDGAANFSFFDLPSPGWVNGAGFPGDFDRDGQIGIRDVNLFCAGLRTGSQDASFDLDRSTRVDLGDLQFLIEGLLQTNFGDANLDGIFDSNDLVLIFQAGQYEDGIPNNSNWATGDWNCDGEFGTQDLVQAFQAGAYVAAAQPMRQAVNRLSTTAAGLHPLPDHQPTAFDMDSDAARELDWPESNPRPTKIMLDVPAPASDRAPSHDRVLAEWDDGLWMADEILLRVIV